MILPAMAAAADPSLLTVGDLKGMSLEQLLDVQVTSVSRHPEKLLEVPSALQVVRGSDIARSTATSLPEALRLAPNLQVAQKNPHDWGISARGFNTAYANKLLVMLDGRTLYTPLLSGVFWDAQDYLLEDIDRIEVVSGPGATLWGANAVNGVINITSKNAKDTLGLYAEGGLGTELESFGAVRYGLQVSPHAYLRVYGKAWDRDDAVNANGTRVSDGWTTQRGGFRFDADLPQDSTATFQGDAYQASEHIVTGGVQKLKGHNLLGRWARAWSRDSDVSVQLYYDHTYLKDPITNQFGSVQYITDRLDTYDLDLQHRFPMGWRHQVVWGLGYRATRDDIQNASNTAFLPPKLNQELFNAFGQDAITLLPDWVLTLGTKLEHNDYTGFELEPSARLAWRVSARQTLWGAVSRAVRMPSRYDRDVFQPRPPPVVFSGNPNFRSETLIAYEVGYKAQPTEAFSLSLSAYFNTYDRLRSFGFAPGTSKPPAMFGNNLEADTYGVEASAQYQLNPSWRVRGGYNYLVEQIRVRPGQNDLWNGRNEVADPKHAATLGSSWDLPWHLSLDINGRAVAALPTTTGHVPGYAEADVKVAWHPTAQLEISVAGQNLLHAHHPEFGVTSPRREDIQRSIYGKVSYRF